MKRLLYLLLVIAQLIGCASSKNNHTAEEIGSEATISGSWIMKDGVELPTHSIMVEAIDGLDVVRDPYQAGGFHPWQAAPGAREISVRLQKRSDAAQLSVSSNPPAIVALLEPDTSYRLRAEYVQGSMVAYWLEEEPDGRRVSPLYFDPPEVPSDLALRAARHIKAEQGASISSSIPGLFVVALDVSEGRGCPVLVREVPEVAVQTHPVLMTLGVVFMVGIPLMTGEPSGVSPPQAKYRMEYQVFRGPCFDVQPGHVYEVRPVEKYAKPVSSLRTRGIRNENGPDIDTRLQIIDAVNEDLVVWQFRLRTQKRFR